MDNRIYIETAYKSLNKHKEELCGDRVDIVKNNENNIIVLSDGLGSGVKANILSTLTSKIISTMMKEGASIEDTVDTIVHTLPVCSVRKVAYSTFSILQIKENGRGYLVEFDSPACIFIRKGKLADIDYNQRVISGKTIKEARFKLNRDDMVILLSDGVVYAGIGASLKLGWTIENVAKFVQENYYDGITARKMTRLITNKCNELYLEKPGDDTTVAVVKIIKPKSVCLFSGPPKNPKKDEILINDFINTEGIKIVCGGSSANIASRILGQEIEASIDYLDPEIPPIGKIKGIDLVTEGVITLKRTVGILKQYFKDPDDEISKKLIDDENGAAKIAKILVEDCTHLNLFIGKTLNPAHVQDDVAGELSIKQIILDELYNIMTQAGCIVTKKIY